LKKIGEDSEKIDESLRDKFQKEEVYKACEKEDKFLKQMTIKPFMQMVKLLDKEQIVRLLQEMRYCDIVISQTAENIIAKQWYKMLKQGKDKEESEEG
jgi:hypothetical protein